MLGGEAELASDGWMDVERVKREKWGACFACTIRQVYASTEIRSDIVSEWRGQRKPLHICIACQRRERERETPKEL